MGCGEVIAGQQGSRTGVPPRDLAHSSLLPFGRWPMGCPELASSGTLLSGPSHLLFVRKQEPVPGGMRATTCHDVACMAVGSCPLSDSVSSCQPADRVTGWQAQAGRPHGQQ